MIVLDASAAVDLLLRNAVGRRVQELFARDELVLAPELIYVEVVSAMTRLVRAGTLADRDAVARINLLHRMPIRRLPHRPLVRRVWELHDRVRISDGFYVACAELVGGALLTTDQRLGRAALPGVTITVVS
ncbi:MAG: type II toxin-antitoxin system VapC family toxin [Actinomycetes bacterium]